MKGEVIIIIVGVILFAVTFGLLVTALAEQHQKQDIINSENLADNCYKSCEAINQEVAYVKDKFMSEHCFCADGNTITEVW